MRLADAGQRRRRNRHRLKRPCRHSGPRPPTHLGRDQKSTTALAITRDRRHALGKPLDRCGGSSKLRSRADCAPARPPDVMTAYVARDREIFLADELGRSRSLMRPDNVHAAAFHALQDAMGEAMQTRSIRALALPPHDRRRGRAHPGGRPSPLDAAHTTDALHGPLKFAPIRADKRTLLISGSDPQQTFQPILAFEICVLDRAAFT